MGPHGTAVFYIEDSCLQYKNYYKFERGIPSPLELSPRSLDTVPLFIYIREDGNAVFFY